MALDTKDASSKKSSSSTDEEDDDVDGIPIIQEQPKKRKSDNVIIFLESSKIIFLSNVNTINIILNSNYINRTKNYYCAFL